MNPLAISAIIGIALLVDFALMGARVEQFQYAPPIASMGHILAAGHSILFFAVTQIPASIQAIMDVRRTDIDIAPIIMALVFCVFAFAEAFLPAVIFGGAVVAAFEAFSSGSAHVWVVCNLLQAIDMHFLPIEIFCAAMAIVGGFQSAFVAVETL